MSTLSFSFLRNKPPLFVFHALFNFSPFLSRFRQLYLPPFSLLRFLFARREPSFQPLILSLSLSQFSLRFCCRFSGDLQTSQPLLHSTLANRVPPPLVRAYPGVQLAIISAGTVVWEPRELGGESQSHHGLHRGTRVSLSFSKLILLSSGFNARSVFRTTLSLSLSRASYKVICLLRINASL